MMRPLTSTASRARTSTSWVERPLALIARLATPSATLAARLEALRAELRAWLTGATLRLGFIHGDYWSENLWLTVAIVASPASSIGTAPTRRNMVAHDLLHFVLYSRKLLRGSEIGAEICRALGPNPRWQPEEQPAIDRVAASGDGGGGLLRVPLLLYWLRIVSENFARQPDATRRRRWVSDNIDAVLACV